MSKRFEIAEEVAFLTLLPFDMCFPKTFITTGEVINTYAKVRYLLFNNNNNDNNLEYCLVFRDQQHINVCEIVDRYLNGGNDFH